MTIASIDYATRARLGVLVLGECRRRTGVARDVAGGGRAVRHASPADRQFGDRTTGDAGHAGERHKAARGCSAGRDRVPLHGGIDVRSAHGWRDPRADGPGEPDPGSGHGGCDPGRSSPAQGRAHPARHPVHRPRAQARDRLAHGQWFPGDRRRLHGDRDQRRNGTPYARSDQRPRAGRGARRPGGCLLHQLHRHPFRRPDRRTGGRARRACHHQQSGARLARAARRRMPTRSGFGRLFDATHAMRDAA